MSDSADFPYQDIVAPLLASTMSAQAILISAYRSGKPASNFHGDINKKFTWLTKNYSKGGVNRHFFDEPDRSSKTLRASGDDVAHPLSGLGVAAKPVDRLQFKPVCLIIWVAGHIADVVENDAVVVPVGKIL